MLKGASRIFREHPERALDSERLWLYFRYTKPTYDGKLVDHAHNDYIETLADLGASGRFIRLAFLGTLFKKGIGGLAKEQSHFSLCVPCRGADGVHRIAFAQPCGF